MHIVMGYEYCFSIMVYVVSLLTVTGTTEVYS